MLHLLTKRIIVRSTPLIHIREIQLTTEKIKELFYCCFGTINYSINNRVRNVFKSKIRKAKSFRGN